MTGNLSISFEYCMILIDYQEIFAWESDGDEPQGDIDSPAAHL